MPAAQDPDDPEEALREIRSRFVAAFSGRCDAVAALLADPGADHARRDGARQIVHRLVGLSGTVGFPTVSQRASELEALLSEDEPLNVAIARDLLNAAREAYVADLMKPPGWAAAAPADAEAVTILIVEDDPDQRALVELQLQRAGHRTISVGRGDQALPTARERRPSVVLLDVDLPGLDGYAVCRALKTDRDVAGIPVIFVTTRATIDARLSGLTLGADDYLCKPVDARELLLRIARLVRRTAPGAPASATERPNGTALTFDAFCAVGASALAAGSAALALVRTSPDQRHHVASILSEEGRRRDVIGQYDETHLVWLMPLLEAPAAAARAAAAITRVRESGGDATAGVSAGSAGSTVAALISEADEALTEARYRREPASVKTDRPAAAGPAVSRTLVLADDDPEVVRVVDSYMRSAGFRTIVAFDGTKALQAVNEHQPDVMILDLMMPGVSGFDVLLRLKGHPARPRVVVLSARGREDDVTRAFELGADDYIVKPFSPQELRARIMRLIK